MHKKYKKLNLPEIYSAENYATYLLSSRMLSAGQIREKLLKKGYKRDETEAIILKFSATKILDDDQYAQVYSENLKKYKNFGYYGIKKKLMERKLSKDLIEKTLSELTLAKERSIATRLLEKSGKNKTPEQRYRMLQSRGFRGEIIAKVVKKYEEGLVSEEFDI